MILEEMGDYVLDSRKCEKDKKCKWKWKWNGKKVNEWMHENKKRESSGRVGRKLGIGRIGIREKNEWVEIGKLNKRIG